MSEILKQTTKWSVCLRSAYNYLKDARSFLTQDQRRNTNDIQQKKQKP